jgi:hypothetical protein
MYSGGRYVVLYQSRIYPLASEMLFLRSYRLAMSRLRNATGDTSIVASEYRSGFLVQSILNCIATILVIAGGDTMVCSVRQGAKVSFLLRASYYVTHLSVIDYMVVDFAEYVVKEMRFYLNSTFFIFPISEIIRPLRL